MFIGTALIVLAWVVFGPMLGCPLWGCIVITVAASLLILFCLLFAVYFFNLDMKLLSKFQDILIKMHDKKAKKKRI